MTPFLNLNGKIFSLSELAEVNPENGVTAFEKSTLAFCREWLGGEHEFSLYTSGSTGTPKKIILNRSQMEASARLTIDALHLKSETNSLVCLDTQYIAGKMMLVRSLINSMNIIAVEPEANPLSKLKNRIDFAAFVPYQVEKILNESKSKLDEIECAIVGGAAVSAALHEKMKHTSCKMFATYGMTETISHIALQKLNGEDAADVFNAQPGMLINVDNRGCLTIKADYLGIDPVITNDLVELLSPSTFKWLGRFDNVINTGGVKVSPENVEKIFEKLFHKHGIKHRFFVGSKPNQKLGQQVILVIEATTLPDNQQQELIKEASLLLGKYELPKAILFVSPFIETATGKINRSATLSKLKF